MKKGLARLAILTSLLLAPAYSARQATSHAAMEEAETERLAGWKWVNFAILAAGLGYVIAKNGPAFFNARSEQIQKAIREATGLKIKADFRFSEMDKRMAGLAAEVHKLRDEAKAAMERETRRFDNETRAALDRIHDHTTREIESLSHQASLAVREHAVRLASDLALSYLKDNPQAINQDGLVHEFAQDVLKGAASA